MTKSALFRAALLASACLAHPAFAQDADPAPDPAAEALDEGNAIVVTGTRVARSELDFANPVVTVSAEAIQESGYTNIADFLVQSPALVNSITGAQTAGSFPDFGESGLDLLNLRNLGTDRTLVLVDGRRHVAAVSGSAAVDINAIPTDLIEAVDVLTGGASAIYGADGVSGVVNFRLKHDFDGITARFQAGTSKYGDGDNLFGAVTFGQNFSEGRGNFAIAYEYSNDERVSDQARPWLRNPVAGALYRNQADIPDDPNIPDLIYYNDVRYADSATMGAVDVDFDYAADYEGNGKLYDRGLVLDESGGYAQGGSSTPVDGYQGDLFPGIERHLVNALAHYEFSDALTLFAEGKYVRSRSETLSQPTFDFYLFQTAENPFMPQSIRDAIIPGAAAEWWFGEPSPDGVLVTRDNYDLGINTEQVTRETWRSVVGAKGAISDHLNYEISYVYGQTKSRVLSRGNRLEAQWQAAIDVVEDPITGDPVCRVSLDPDAPPEMAGCVPYNIFGEYDQDPAAIAFVTTDSLSKSKVTQHVVSGSISGDTTGLFELPGGPVGFALGAEYRKESSRFDPDAMIAAGLTWQGAVQPSSGSYDVKELFGEINLPILKNVPGAYLLSLGAAARYSDYSTVGGTTTWKVDGVYAPIPDISFRATYSQAVRAPNIGELFGAPSTAYNFIVDPCDTQETNNGTSYREANCASLLSSMGIDPTTFQPSNAPEVASVYTEGLASGNPDLQEETAKTWTAGVVLRPSFIPGFSFSADWYDIKIEDAINTPEAQDLARLCVDQPTLDNQFCPGIERDPDTGYIMGFSVMPANVAQFRTAGLDLTMGYRLPTARLGTFNVTLVGNYLDRLEFISSPGADVNSDKGEMFAPEYSATFDLTWEMEPVTINYGINWFSSTDRFTAEDLAGDPDYADPSYFKIKAKWEHDFQISYNIADKVDLYAGMQNIFDSRPDFAYSYYPISGMGRFVYAGVTVSLGPVF
ncbi:TonB-dependent receptor [Erythrobacter sp. SG61-1L]|uniref:TonB-dependent receptor domain-containing protein n=1 Tax=Erythrobacter sp. SG61-1L TaxID=1603897 RepID=UPI0006C9327C|nr:TonB-dependent receptor [Erythrobacter sp. SG61-1L]KPL66826.1 TonB-dependent receptor [Erythrobacter sp. SG61-1L]